MLDAIPTVEAAGGKVALPLRRRPRRQGDRRGDRAASRSHGRLDVILHAAGIERSRSLDDKPVEEFELIFDVKVHGLCNLLRAPRRTSTSRRWSASRRSPAASATPARPTTARATTSSARSALALGARRDQGRVGDRARLDGLGRHRHGHPRQHPRDHEARRHRDARARGRRPGRPPTCSTAGSRGEPVVGRALGILLAPRDAEGGLDLEALLARRAAADTARHDGRRAVARPVRGPRRRVTLDPKTEPFLQDHAIDGTPVLPGVMGLEGFAEVGAAARSRATTSRRSRTCGSSRR